MAKLNAIQIALLSGTAFAGFVTVGGFLAPEQAQAQVSLPKTGTLNGAQPVFCVNPTTAAIEDCAAGNITATNPSVSTTGTAVPGNATYVAFSNAGGNLTGISATNPLPVSATNPSVGQTGSAVPGNVTYQGLNFGGNSKGWVGDTNGYGDVNVMNSPAVTVTSGAITETNSAAILTAAQASIPTGNNTIGNIGGETHYANRTNWVGNTTTIANTTAATVIPTPGAGNSIFVTDYNCSNTSATNVTVTFNDNPGTVEIVPATGGFVMNLAEAREVAGNTALTMTLSANATSVSCTASGYKATT